MDKGRIVNTNFWRDTYVVELDPTEKLLFLYFLTNPATNMAGVYEVSYKQAAFDTGIDKDMVERILKRFIADEKMYYERGWLVLRNFIRHQRLNPSVRSGISKSIRLLPDWLQQRLIFVETKENMHLKISGFEQSVDSLSQTGTNIIESNLTKPNLIQSNVSNTPNGVLAKAGYGDKNINALFDYWEKTIGYPIKSRIKTNRNACATLLKSRSVEEMQRLIDGVALAHEDRYAPSVSDFTELQANMNRFLAWGHKRLKTKEQAIVSI